jgi:pimeloyl-ACP methyl ester carboxylesterase
MLDVRRRAVEGGARMIVMPSLSRDSLLFLHGDDGPLAAQPFVDALQAGMAVPAAGVVMPTCPGWSQEPVPVWLRTVDQLAYHYLDALDRSATGPVIAIGASFGAWLLLEMATKQPKSFSALVLISPIGIKITDRETPQFTDLFAHDIADRASALYADPEGALRRMANLDDHEILALAVAQEALARFGWEPYLHNPLLHRRLQRVKCPTAIVHGSDDIFVANLDYYRRLAALFGGTTWLTSIAGAGHRVEEEQPVALAQSVLDFVRDVR